MKSITFKHTMIPLSLIGIIAMILLIGLVYSLFSISEVFLYVIAILFLFIVIGDIRKFSSKGKGSQFPLKYILIGLAFLLVSFLS
ncbi:hypothetical protein [Anaerobacillus sp. 1_MG-2023]|uniref:hypothetical protein n=1 Tax=Anaerobacillus sp. 1_MG-2023 TaxID=3062655 RepID=UPI0026E30741|nr:hypothetical protein [Anaerobacillus sp. 1_MG-2023]MDO6654655.1 hypothetical protein [Anaerobacillus sp. 1_MG-2023]